MGGKQDFRLCAYSKVWLIYLAEARSSNTAFVRKQWICGLTEFVVVAVLTFEVIEKIEGREQNSKSDKGRGVCFYFSTSNY